MNETNPIWARESPKHPFHLFGARQKSGYDNTEFRESACRCACIGEKNVCLMFEQNDKSRVCRSCLRTYMGKENPPPFGKHSSNGQKAHKEEINSLLKASEIISTGWEELAKRLQEENKGYRSLLQEWIDILADPKSNQDSVMLLLQMTETALKQPS